MRRSPRKASLFLAVMTLWLRVGLSGLRRGAAPTLIDSFPKQTYRIGEAANLGPYSEGGASSSTSVAPFGMSFSRSVDQAAVGAALASGVAIGHEAEESRAAAMRRATGAGFCSSDDPGDWTFAEVHDASEMRPWLPSPEWCARQAVAGQVGFAAVVIAWPGFWWFLFGSLVLSVPLPLRSSRLRASLRGCSRRPPLSQF